MRFVLDSNIYDAVVASDEVRHAAIQKVSTGEIVFLMTHVQYDELRAIPDGDKRRAIFEIPFDVRPTYGFVLDLSKLGMARPAEHEQIEPLRTRGRGGCKDALIAATAQYEGATLVVNVDVPVVPNVGSRSPGVAIAPCARTTVTTTATTSSRGRTRFPIIARLSTAGHAVRVDGFIEIAQRTGELALTLVGMDEDEAKGIAAKAARGFRVIEVDGRERAVTADLNPRRINVRIHAHKVIATKVG